MTAAKREQTESWNETMLRRIEEKICPEPNSGCHIWLGATTKMGTPQIGLAGENKTGNACRILYAILNGPIPEGMVVCHKCDVRSCMNPDHFFLGSKHDNALDMAAKGRGTKSRLGLPFGVIARPWGRFAAQVTFKRKQIHLGTYATAEEASAVAVAEKERQLAAWRAGFPHLRAALGIEGEG